MGIRPLRLIEFAPGRPYHAALVPIRPDFRVESPHTHVDFYEIMCVVEGTGIHRARGRDIVLSVGDVALIRPSDEHEFAAPQAPGMSFVNVAFSVGMWRSFLDLTGVRALTDWDGAAMPVQASLGTTDPEAAAEVTAEAHRVLAAYHRGATALDLVRFLSAVTPVLLRADTGMADADTVPAWLHRACTAMTEEEGLRAGLSRLVTEAGVSSGHLARAMRTHYGCSPIAYVTERRLVHGAILLGTTAVPVEEVAQRCGFDGASYFGRLFRRRFGMSPRDYRGAARRAVVPQA